jgi:hypothetical protein
LDFDYTDRIKTREKTMSKKQEGSKSEYARHLRKIGKRMANKGYRRYSKNNLKTLAG